MITIVSSADDGISARLNFGLYGFISINLSANHNYEEKTNIRNNYFYY